MPGGIHASPRDRADAAAVEAAFPGTMQQVHDLRALHSRAAARAVREQGVKGIVVAAAGFPCEPDPHAEALRVAPGTRVVLADPDAEVTLINEAVLARDPRVSAVRARTLDVTGLLCSPQVLSLPAPLLLLLPVVAALWPPDAAAQALKEYRRFMPPGSLLAMTLRVPDCGPGGQEVLKLWRQLVGPIYGHRVQDVAAWLADAGFKGIGPGAEVPRVEDARVLSESMRWMENAYRGTHPACW